jgi:N-acetylglutamate synthase/N-acetylornithine aminotransferase
MQRYIEKFIRYLDIEKGYSAHTILNYRVDLRGFSRFLGVYEEFRNELKIHGIKKVKDSLDLAILFSEAPCVAAGVFTTNRIKAAPVLLSQKRLQAGKAVAVVINAGCANACTGQKGINNAVAMCKRTSEETKTRPYNVLVPLLA